MSLQPRLAMRATPALVVTMRMLAMSSADLEREVERELAENAALERVERPLADAGSLLGGTEHGSSDHLLLVADEPSPADALLAEVRLLVAERDHGVAAHVVGSLDARGYLRATVEEIASAVGVEPVRVQRVISAIREVAPVGSCARDLRECLNLQLERFDDSDDTVRLARVLVDGHLEDLAAGCFGKVARRLGVERSAVIAARDLIRRRLRPGVAFESPAARGGITPAGVPLPGADVVVRERIERRGEYDVEVMERRRLAVRVNAGYARHIPLADVVRARTFVRHLQMRWDTLQTVSEHVVGRQRGFLRHGADALAQLTRAEVAWALGLHPSTVGRAIAGRNVLLPCGRLVPYATFFRAELPVHRALERIVEAERRPLSDGELARALAVDGHVVARRTVAKYRHALGILPQPLR